MTTANGYLSLVLFPIQQSELLEEKKICLQRVVSFIASAYAPMFLRSHLKPRASHGPENVLFL